MIASKSNKSSISPAALRRRDLFLLGKEVFGTEEKFRSWLSFCLNKNTGLSLKSALSNKKNYQLLVNQLERIQHGILA